MKKIICLIPVILYTLLSFTCAGEDNFAYATVTVYNQSEYKVTELYLVGAGFVSELEQGEERAYNVEWAPGVPYAFSVIYSINGETFNAESMEGAMYTSNAGREDGKGGYFSPYFIKDGAKAFVYIKNEGYSLEMIGGEYHEMKDGKYQW